MTFDEEYKETGKHHKVIPAISILIIDSKAEILWSMFLKILLIVKQKTSIHVKMDFPWRKLSFSEWHELTCNNLLALLDLVGFSRL